MPRRHSHCLGHFSTPWGPDSQEGCRKLPRPQPGHLLPQHRKASCWIDLSVLIHAHRLSFKVLSKGVPRIQDARLRDVLLRNTQRVRIAETRPHSPSSQAWAHPGGAWPPLNRGRAGTGALFPGRVREGGPVPLCPAHPSSPGPARALRTPKRKSAQRFLFSWPLGTLGNERGVVKPNRSPPPRGDPSAGGSHAAGSRKTT